MTIDVMPNCVAIDTETNGINPWRGDRMFSCAAAFPNGRRLFWRDEFSGLRELLADPTVDKVFHNADFDLRMLEFSGFEVKGKVWDTMIFCHLLDGRDATLAGLRLDDMSRKYLPREYRKQTEDIKKFFADEKGKVNKATVDFTKLPPELLRSRNIGDANLTLRLFSRMYATVRKTFPLLLDQEHRLLPVVKRMKDRGILVDAAEIARQEEYFTDIIEDVRMHCEGILGGDEWFNVNSRKHLEILFRKINVWHRFTERTQPSKRHPKGQLRFTERTIRDTHHPTGHMILLGKAAAKMRDTFLSAAIEHQTDGVLHPSFKQLGTTTGRFSCAEPNLMNIPREGRQRTASTDDEAAEVIEATGVDYAPQIKRIFKVRPGFLHMHSDKAQAEVRMLAHYANDKKLMEGFAQGGSIHDFLCKLLFDGEVNSTLKIREKAVLFGYQYGAGAPTIAKNINSTVAEASAIRKKLATMLPALPAWRKKLESELEDNGYVKTIHGRRHYLYRGEAYMTVNRMCQGTVGDDVKSRMVALDEWIESNGYRDAATIIIMVHDDVCIEVREDVAPEVVPELVRIMNEVDPRTPYLLPMPADCGIAYDHWGNKRDVENPNDPSTWTREELLKK